jgi:hypothetical protein
MLHTDTVFMSTITGNRWRIVEHRGDGSVKVEGLDIESDVPLAPGCYYTCNFAEDTFADHPAMVVVAEPIDGGGSSCRV